MHEHRGLLWVVMKNYKIMDSPHLHQLKELKVILIHFKIIFFIYKLISLLLRQNKMLISLK